jgi:hypothetical protein
LVSLREQLAHLTDSQCKRDAKKKKESPPTNPARANGDHPKRGQENYSIDLPIDIVGISEMQKCGLKYDMLSLSSIVLQRYGIRTAD